MKNIMRYTLWMLTVATTLFMGCSVDYPSSSEKTLPLITTSGTANFTKFMVVGNSLTAGYQNGGLAEKFQINSYGAQIARQLGHTDAGELGSDFEQPLVANPGTTGILVLNSSTTRPVTDTSAHVTTPLNLGLATPYDNMAVPGAFVYDFLNTTSSATCWAAAVLGGGPTANPLFDLILRTGGSQFTQVKASSPTFVVWWEGHNDILGFATGGAGVNGTPGAYAVRSAPPWTPRNSGEATAFGMPASFVFSTAYTRAIDSLTSGSMGGAKLIVGNIPNITDIPFFTTAYPSSSIPDTVYRLITNPLTGAKTTIYFEENRDSIQYMTFLTLSVLGTTSGLGSPTQPYGLHPVRPLGGQFTLTYAEVRLIKSIIDQYNTDIQTAAVAKGIPVVDFKSIFADIAAHGRSYDGGYVANAKFLSGGLFSLDAVHPSTLGYAVIANAFIDVINDFYGSEIPKINEVKYIDLK